MNDPSVHEALLQEKAGDKVRCLTCERRCLLAPGASGWCRTRTNLDGVLVTLTYGQISSQGPSH
jgi:pyruvate formate lyase activating enzyme